MTLNIKQRKRNPFVEENGSADMKYSKELNCVKC